MKQLFEAVDGCKDMALSSKAARAKMVTGLAMAAISSEMTTGSSSRTSTDLEALTATANQLYGTLSKAEQEQVARAVFAAVGKNDESGFFAKIARGEVQGWDPKTGFMGVMGLVKESAAKGHLSAETARVNLGTASESIITQTASELEASIAKAEGNYKLLHGRSGTSIDVHDFSKDMAQVQSLRKVASGLHEQFADGGNGKKLRFDSIINAVSSVIALEESGLQVSGDVRTMISDSAKKAESVSQGAAQRFKEQFFKGNALRDEAKKLETRADQAEKEFAAQCNRIDRAVSVHNHVQTQIMPVISRHDQDVTITEEVKGDLVKSADLVQQSVGYGAEVARTVRELLKEAGKEAKLSSPQEAANALSTAANELLAAFSGPRPESELRVSSAVAEAITLQAIENGLTDPRMRAVLEDMGMTAEDLLDTSKYIQFAREYMGPDASRLTPDFALVNSSPNRVMSPQLRARVDQSVDAVLSIAAQGGDFGTALITFAQGNEPVYATESRLLLSRAGVENVSLSMADRLAGRQGVRIEKTLEDEFSTLTKYANGMIAGVTWGSLLAVGVSATTVVLGNGGAEALSRGLESISNSSAGMIVESIKAYASNMAAEAAAAAEKAKIALEEIARLNQDLATLQQAGAEAVSNVGRISATEAASSVSQAISENQGLVSAAENARIAAQQATENAATNTEFVQSATQIINSGIEAAGEFVARLTSSPIVNAAASVISGIALFGKKVFQRKGEIAAENA